jgi:hypothetical protein
MKPAAHIAEFTKPGIEKVGAVVTRGVMIDVAGYKGVDMLGETYEITVADLEGALKKEELTLQADFPQLSRRGYWMPRFRRA